MRFLRAADRREDLLRNAREGRNVAGVFDKQGWLLDGWCSLYQRGIRAQAGPGGQPRFGRAVTREAHRAVVGGTRILAPQCAVGALGRIDRQIEAAGIGVGAPHRHDGGVRTGSAETLVAAILGSLARVHPGRDQLLGNRVELGDARALTVAIALQELRLILRGAWWFRKSVFRIK